MSEQTTEQQQVEEQVGNTPDEASAIPQLNARTTTRIEQQRSAWFEQQRLMSVDNMEKAARQIITLTTALLSIVFGLLALNEAEVPPFLASGELQLAAAAGILGLFFALLTALFVVFPFPMVVTLNDPEAQADEFEFLLDRKGSFLQAAVVGFIIGMAGIAWIVVRTLWLMA